MIQCFGKFTVDLKFSEGERPQDFWAPAQPILLFTYDFTCSLGRKNSQPLKVYQGEMFLDHTPNPVDCAVSMDFSLHEEEPFLYKADFSAWMHTWVKLKFHSKGHTSYDVVLQLSRNKRMHSINGNTTRSVVLLEYLVPPPIFRYDRTFLLKYRDHTPHVDQWFDSSPNIKTIPQSHPIQPTTFKQSRSGRRIRYIDSNGNFVNFTPKRKKSLRDAPNSGISMNSLSAGSAASSASVRHAGSPFRANEVRPQIRGGNQPSSQGARRRRLCRRAYRAWRKEGIQILPKGADSRSAIPPLQSTKVSLKKAAIFRNTIEWQHAINRKKKPSRERIQTTPPLTYDAKLRVGAQNVQGLADTLKLKNLILVMKEHNLGVMILTETKSTSYYSYTSEQHLVVQSGNHKDRYAGVGAIIHPKLRPHLADVVQVSNRIIHLTFNKKGGRIHVVGVYAPHSGLDHDTVRQPFWEALEEYLSKIPQPEPVYVTGDFNVRFQAQHSNDQGVTGPFTYGKGSRYIDHSATSNRSLCVRTMSLLGMLEVGSYRSPNPAHQITYRDKTAPPTDWSQFALDPLILQQFYAKAFHEFGEGALEISSHVRAFLDLPQPLPPTQNAPHPDPARFQRLDHCFTRTQWLPTINSCRSKLHTGFPSDHYLLVTELQIKLAQRKQAPKYRPKIDFSQVTQTMRANFNASLKPQLTPSTQTSDHTAKAVFYTDGAGTEGRATRVTPAGWGWALRQGSDWLEASGPVSTDPHHIKYLGSRVGSNNTGELSAIIEALLFALEHDYTQVVIHSDSQWSINMITGKWRPKTNKELVILAQRLAFRSGLTVHLQWVKGHADIEGNVLADRLAGEGRDRQTYKGGRTIPLPQARAPSNSDHTAPLEHFVGLLNAAAKSLPLLQRNSAKPWISEDTLRALQKARQAQAMQTEDCRQLRNLAKRSARRDRVRWVHDQLQADPTGSSSAVWNTVRRQKRGFQGKRPFPGLRLTRPFATT